MPLQNLADSSSDPQSQDIVLLAPCLLGLLYAPESTRMLTIR